MLSLRPVGVISLNEPVSMSRAIIFFPWARKALMRSNVFGEVVTK